MNTAAYDITVICAGHGDSCQKAPAFAHQTYPADRIQMLYIQEEDFVFPRRASLMAISRACGRYTILLDEEDTFDTDFLERMYQGAESSCAAFSMSAQVFPRVKRVVQYFAQKVPSDQTIDVSRELTVFPMELHGLMIPTDVLQEACAKYLTSPQPEKQMLLYILGKNPVFRFLGTLQLSYSIPRECDPEYDLRCLTHEWYYEPFHQFLLPALQARAARDVSAAAAAKASDQTDPALTCADTDRMLQAMALHMINARLFANADNRNKHILEPEEVLPYCRLLTDILQYVETPLILCPDEQCLPASSTPQRKLFLLRLKKNDFSYYPTLHCTDQGAMLLCDGVEFCDFAQIPLRLIQLDYRGGCLEADGAYLDFIPPEAQILAKFDGTYYPLTLNQRYSMTKYFGVTAFRMKTFHTTVPVAQSDRQRILQFVLKVQEREYVLDYAFPSQGSRFAKDFGYAYWRFGPYLSYWQKDGIHVVRSRKLTVLKKEIALWLQMWKKKDGFYRYQLPTKIINFLLRPYFAHQKIWLFLDKIYKGGDSSEYMYRYAVKQNDGIKKYYLLDKTSADYARMRKEGYRPLVRGTLRHRLVFLNADMVIASNSTVFAFNDYPFDRSLPIRGDVHFDVACVQHGMSVQKIAIAQNRLRDNTRLYFCASKYEIKNLSKPVYDYAGYDALKLTGVPRYDGLVNRAEKILVISPTWRMQSALPVTRSEGVSRDFNPHFKETNYFKVYNSLINDPRLLDAARRYGYRIQYVLHPIISPQHEDFDKNDVVEIIPSIGDMSYEKIFCEGALMVTDFSGVQFDFAYMRKPVIYLHHHDIPQHYEEGTFFYDTMGFGEICHTNDELIQVLCRYMEHDCVMPELYRKRADDFFAYSDHNNCARIYPIMLEHEKNRER